jgi:hypothetical protein
VTRLTIEQLHHDCIDIRELSRLGALTGVWRLLDGPLRWPEIAEFQAVRYRLKVQLRNQSMPQYYVVEWTRCYFGGWRPWIRCSCGKRVAILYRGLGGYCCRDCVGHPRYACQTKSANNRRHFKACKTRLLLRGNASLEQPFPKKPKGMHWRTYNRIRRATEALEQRLPRYFRRKVPDYPNLMAYME